ncbi:hypothetical protein Bbelb_282970 [Branchiostoma belcheri]|nr:hypothetical protein Bbelb_282970 [Branchiostoma belcheri]
MHGADEIIVLVQYRSGICRRHLGKRAGPSRSIYRAVTGGHTVGTPKQALTGGHAVGTPKQARGAVLIPFPYSYKRSNRRQGQASAWGRVDPFTVQSRGVMPVGLEHRDRVGLFTVQSKGAPLTGASLKALHFTPLMEHHKQMGVTIAVGDSSTGKSLCTTIALAPTGMHESSFYKSMSEAKGVARATTCGLPFAINDVKSAKVLENFIMPAFEGGLMANCTREVKQRESSRIVIIPFNIPVSLTAEDKDQIGELQAVASQADNYIREIQQAISQRMKDDLEVTTKARLASIYAIEASCTRVFAEYLGIPTVSEEAVTSFFIEDVVRSGLVPYQLEMAVNVNDTSG